MTEAIMSSSPTKTLSTWWKSFKQKENDDESVQSVQRPGFNRASLSSSAVPRVSDSQRDHAAKTHGVDIPPQYIESPIFGAPLTVSLRYASVNISLADRDGQSFVYGHVPIIVAKCAVFLKQGARETEGIFRVPGSVRRIKVLQDLFNTPPNFGKDLEWQGFTVHDAANLLKRYLTQLPESIVPRRYYSVFRKPLQTQFTGIRDYMNYHAVTGPSSPSHQAETSAAAPPEPSTEDVNEAVKAYEDLIFKLPPSSLQLLVYLLDLLSMFAAQSDTNRMPAYNLAAIFQPSVLSIPEHAMNPDEYQTSRLVIQFLINHSLTILRRVEARAIEEHTNRNKPKEPMDDLVEEQELEAAGAEDARDEAGINMAEIPKLTLEQAEQDQMLTPRPSAEQETPGLYTSASPLPGSHRRQHSKSLSSAQPPNMQDQHKLPGFLRRQRSHRLESDEGDDHCADDAPARHSTRSPPIEEEDRKSLFRRSLMVLLPNRDDHLSPRPTSPQASTSKPELNRSPSWFARLSSNTASRSGSPDEPSPKG